MEKAPLESQETAPQIQGIELSGMTDLRSFENDIANYLLPEMNEDQAGDWAARADINDLLKPPRNFKFNGNIVNIKAEPINDPYQEITRAIEDDEPFLRQSSARNIRLTILSAKASEAINTNEFTKDTKSSAIGFHLSAGLRSSKGGIIGTVEADLFYLPVEKHKLLNKDPSKIKSGGKKDIPAVNRYVSRPRFEMREKQTKSLTKDVVALGGATVRASLENQGSISKNGRYVPRNSSQDLY